MLVSVPLAGWEAWRCYYPSIIKSPKSSHVLNILLNLSSPMPHGHLCSLPNSQAMTFCSYSWVSHDKEWKQTMAAWLNNQIKLLVSSSVCPLSPLSVVWAVSVTAAVQRLTGGFRRGKGEWGVLPDLPNQLLFR